MASFVLVNSDGHRVEIEKEWCAHIKLLENLMGIDLGKSNEMVEVPVGDRLTSESMDHIRTYFQLLGENPQTTIKPLHVLELSGNETIEIEAPEFMLKKWEQKFVDQLDEDSLYNLMIAANYLDIPNLLDLCTTSVANMIRRESAEKIRECLDISCDLSQDEINRIEMENVWLAD